MFIFSLDFCTWKVHIKIKGDIYEPGKHSLGGGNYKYVLGLGWAAYLLGVFKDKISIDDYNDILKNVIMADVYRTTPFPELRDYQNDDVLFLLKYRTGLYCVNTGYGLVVLPS